jgi:hypothetical protein
MTDTSRATDLGGVAIADPASKGTTLTYNASNQLTGVSRLRTPASGSAQVS